MAIQSIQSCVEPSDVWLPFNSYLCSWLCWSKIVCHERTAWKMQAGSGGRRGAGVFEQGCGVGRMFGKVWLGKTNHQHYQPSQLITIQGVGLLLASSHAFWITHIQDASQTVADSARI